MPVEPLCLFLFCLVSWTSAQTTCASLTTCSSCNSKAGCCWSFGKCGDVSSSCPSWSQRCPLPLPSRSAGISPSVNLLVSLPSYFSISANLHEPLKTRVSCSPGITCNLVCSPRRPQPKWNGFFGTEDVLVAAALPTRAFFGTKSAGTLFLIPSLKSSTEKKKCTDICTSSTLRHHQQGVRTNFHGSDQIQSWNSRWYFN